MPLDQQAIVSPSLQNGSQRNHSSRLQLSIAGPHLTHTHTLCVHHLRERKSSTLALPTSHHRLIVMPANTHFRQMVGLVRELNPGPLAPEARIIRLDQQAYQLLSLGLSSSRSTVGKREKAKWHLHPTRARQQEVRLHRLRW